MSWFMFEILRYVVLTVQIAFGLYIVVKVVQDLTKGK